MWRELRMSLQILYLPSDLNFKLIIDSWLHYIQLGNLFHKDMLEAIPGFEGKHTTIIVK